MRKSSLASNIHIMTLLSIFNDGWNNSNDIASSINIHPVLVRKELKRLKNANLIESKEGKNGGVRLAKPAKDIKLSDIFEALNNSEHIFELRTESPNPSCRVGKQINNQLDTLFESINEAVLEKLKNMSLQDFAANF